MRKWKDLDPKPDPDPYLLWLMDPYPEGPKTCGSGPSALISNNSTLKCGLFWYADPEKLTISSPLLDTRAWVEPRLILWILDAACSASALAQMTSNSPNSPRGLTVRLQGGLPFNFSCSSLNFLSLNFHRWIFLSFLSILQFSCLFPIFSASPCPLHLTSSPSLL